MNIPLLYLLGKPLSKSQEDYIRNALSITPVSGVIVTQSTDIPAAAAFSPNVVLDNQPETDLIHRYLAVARELNSPLALILDSPIPFQVVYNDTLQEAIAC